MAFQQLNQPTTRMRAIYDRVKALQPSIFGKSRLTVPGRLRSEVSIQGTLNSVSFQILENQGQQNVTERRLKITDNFVITDYGFYLMKAGTTVAATQPEIAVAQLNTFANALVFTAANEADNLHSIYNGKYKIAVNQDIFIDDDLMYKFYRVPTAQFGAGTVANPNNGWDNMNYGLCPMEPTIGFSGIGKNEVTVNFPSPLDMSGTSSQNFLVFIANGYNIVNANTGNI